MSLAPILGLSQWLLGLLKAEDPVVRQSEEDGDERLEGDVGELVSRHVDPFRLPIPITSGRVRTETASRAVPSSVS